MLELKNINFSYGKTSVLNNFSMKVYNGESVAIKGASGIGKSTILRIIAGLEKVNSGEIIFNNNNITNLPSYKRNFGYLFQDYALFPNMNVYNNIKYGISNLKKNERDLLIKEYSNMLDLDSLLDRYPHEISGGQKQRVALARTLVTKPNILLLDEPFSALDADLKESVRISLLNMFQKLKLTIILVTHDIEDARVLCTRIISI